MFTMKPGHNSVLRAAMSLNEPVRAGAAHTAPANVFPSIISPNIKVAKP